MTNKVIEPESTTTSLFEGHLLSTNSGKPQIHFTQYNYWKSGIFLLLFIAFVWLYVKNRKKMGQVFKTFYQARSTNDNARDEFSLGNRVSVLLAIFFVVNLSIFISQTLSFYGITLFTEIPTEVIVVIFIIIAYGIKFMTIKFLGYLFQVQGKASEYMIAIYLFCNVMGLLMLPVVICLTFLREMNPMFLIVGGAILIIVFACFRVLKGINIGLKNPKISKVYLFMYLCTLEILPIILMVKIFRMNILSI